MLPEEIFTELHANPEWFGTLTQANADCAKFPQWYGTVREQLLALAMEDGLLTADEKPATVAGNAPIPAGVAVESRGDISLPGTGPAAP